MPDTAPPPGPASAPSPAPRRRRRRTPGDVALSLASRSSALLIILMIGALIFILARSAMPSIREYGLKFITTTEWRANDLEVPKRGPDGKIVFEDGEAVMETKPAVFGALPVIYGTAVSSAIALVFAVPLSFGAALFLTRLAPKWMVGPVSFLIEFLAAIPSIAYGLWGLFVLAPLLQHGIEPGIESLLSSVPGVQWLFMDKGRPVPLTGRDMLCGGLILGVMVLPIITAISRDVLREVPRAQIEGTLALGATWWQSAWETLRYARAGLFGAVMLGLARASGETMAVTMVIGNNNQISASPFAPAQTMSSLLATQFAEASSGLHRSSLVLVALILLIMSLAFNVVARFLFVGKGSTSAAAH
jgi:phosphate transport system permease protein